MTRPLLLLLALATPAAGTGCAFARKMTASRDRPANSVLVSELPPEQRPGYREPTAPVDRDVRDVDRQSEFERVRHDATNGRDDGGRSRADDFADAPIESTEPQPRHGWASMLNPFHRGRAHPEPPARAIPVPRNDLPEPGEPGSDEATSTQPVAVEDDFDLFGGF